MEKFVITQKFPNGKEKPTSIVEAGDAFQALGVDRDDQNVALYAKCVGVENLYPWDEYAFKLDDYKAAHPDWDGTLLS